MRKSTLALFAAAIIIGTAIGITVVQHAKTKLATASLKTEREITLATRGNDPWPLIQNVFEIDGKPQTVIPKVAFDPRRMKDIPVVGNGPALNETISVPAKIIGNKQS